MSENIFFCLYLPLAAFRSLNFLAPPLSRRLERGWACRQDAGQWGAEEASPPRPARQGLGGERDSTRGLDAFASISHVLHIAANFVLSSREVRPLPQSFGRSLRIRQATRA